MDQTPNGATHLIERLRSGERRALGELFDALERLEEAVGSLPGGWEGI
jgi:hypothetical protein